MGLSTASTFLKAGVLMSFLAALCHVIGFATPSWRKLGSASEQGLWRGCTLNICADIRGGDKFKAVQAMETIGLICLGAVLIAAILFLFIDSMRRRSIRSFLIGGSLLGVVAIIIGVIIYGVDFLGQGYKGSYSFGLSITGAILALIAAILYLLDKPR